MTRLAAVLVLSSTLALGACGGSSGGGSSSSSSSSGGSSASGGGGGTAVTIQNFKYQPSAITVKPGAKVTWTNKDSTEHTATASDGKSFNTGTLNQGESKTVTMPTKPGTYQYTCSFHAFMHGTVTVK